MSVRLSSAGGVVALLQEPEPQIQYHALVALDNLVDTHWAEIAPAIPVIEELYDNESFPDRELAASVASKLFYHLESLNDALRYALGAGLRFDISSSSEYVNTLISKCVDSYIEDRVEEEKAIDPRLETVVERMFERCFEDGQYQHALGIALESRRLDIARRAIVESSDVAEMLKHSFNLSQTAIYHRGFRTDFLRELVSIYFEQDSEDSSSICQCLLYLDDAESIASHLEELIRDPDVSKCLKAFQVAFELSENQNQPFLLRVANALPETPQAKDTGDNDDMAVDTNSADQEFIDKLENLKKILSGEAATELFLQFLHANCQSDLLIVKHIKEKVEGRNSVNHFAAITSYALMFAGTAKDKFIRKNLDWLTKSNHWAKFSATASFGVLHQGHLKKSMQLFQPYLPQVGVESSHYLSGGAFYGMGLIHANRGGDRLDYLLTQLASAQDEVVQHGACLGIGLNGLSTSRPEVYDRLKDILYQDNAVAGEAAGLAMGMVMLGSGDPRALEEMVAYAQDTAHEKIIRGLSIGIALVMLGREEQSDVLVEQLITDKDPILRYGACYTLGMAFAATGNNKAIARLLHVAVSDVSADVRRAAVISLGFVLCHQPEKVPTVVGLLAESYNPHVRYGSALAIGIACCSTGSPAAIALLKKLLKDRVDFVRQGSLIAMSMVLNSVTSKKEPYVEEFRKYLLQVVGAKMSNTMTKLGAIIGHGIIDAGGRNSYISLISQGGKKRILSIVGMVMFTQYWYWYPLIHCVSLVFSPTCLIGLNKDLQMPMNFQVLSSAPPSTFAYPEPFEEKKDEVVKQEYNAELSISAKAKARAAKRRKEREQEEGDEGEGDGMDMDAAEEEEKKENEPEPEPEPEADEEFLSNPSRVVPMQRSVLSLVANQRYVPVSNILHGIVMLEDTMPDLEEELVVPEQPKALGVGEEEEPEPPQPFEFLR